MKITRLGMLPFRGLRWATLAVLVPFLFGCATEGPPAVANNGPPTSYRFWPNEPPRPQIYQQPRIIYVNPPQYRVVDPLDPAEMERRSAESRQFLRDWQQETEAQARHDQLMHQLNDLNWNLQFRNSFLK